MADISANFLGIKSPNPFWLASAPPTDKQYNVLRAFEAGWGGVVWKTLGSQVKNVSSRYSAVNYNGSRVMGFNNIELISDRPLYLNLREIAECVRLFPDRAMIVSLMADNTREKWHELIAQVEDTGAHGLELNFGCPHGMTERKMGSEMGEHPDLTEEVTSWVTEVAKIPVWAKMTPNITNIREPALAAVAGGAVGISAINTILSVIGVDLETLRPMPTVEGHCVPGGYSAQAVRPIALRMVSQLALGLPEGVTISGIGGIENSHDALEFMLLGSSTVQICTGVMLQGVKMIDELKEGVEKFMVDKGFSSIQEIIGKSLPYFSTHMELVQKMKAAKRLKAGEASRDNEWAQKDITEKTAELTSN